MVDSTKSPYSNVVIDSDVEREFAESLEQNKNVIVYAKLPNWFKISTPLGNYNPDWAILVKPNLEKEEEKLYFVAETKGSIFESERRELENLKIKCGKEHFKAISEEVKFEVANNFEKLMDKF